MNEFVSLDGKTKACFRGLPIDILKDLIPTETQWIDHDGNLKKLWFDWGKVTERSREDDLRIKFNSKSLIFAIPLQRRSELLSKSAFPNHILGYLKTENPAAPQFKKHLKALLKKYDGVLFHEDHQNVMFLKTDFEEVPTSSLEFQERCQKWWDESARYRDKHLLILLIDLLLKANEPELTKHFIAKFYP